MMAGASLGLSGGWRRSPARVPGSSRAGAALAWARSSGLADGHYGVGAADRAARLCRGDDGGLVRGDHGESRGAAAGGGDGGEGVEQEPGPERDGEGVAFDGERDCRGEAGFVSGAGFDVDAAGSASVSYTHLTLPT